MTTYVPMPGSNTEAAINFVVNNGPKRSKEIAEAIGVDPSSVPVLLSLAVEYGTLVMCKVEVPGTVPQNEYRAGGGMPPPKFGDLSINPAKRPPSGQFRREATEPKAAPAPTDREVRRDQLKRELQVNDAIPARRNTAPSRPAPKVKSATGQRVDRQQQVIDLLTLRQVPTTIDELQQLIADATRSAIIQACRKAQRKGVIDSVALNGHERAYFAPGVSQPGANASPAATPPISENHEKGSVLPAAKVRKTAVHKTALLHQKTATLPFRCGVMSDGSLILDGDFPISAEGIRLDREKTSHLVDYLRRIEMLGEGARNGH